MVLDDIDKLKRNNQELQEIINNSWDGIAIIDTNSKFVYLNNAFMPMLGYSKEELLKKEFIYFMKDEYKQSFLELLVLDFKENKYKAEIDIVCIRKDEKRVYLRVTISSMLNKKLFVINAKDITTRISDSEILDDYVISMHTDLHGHITKVSSAFLKLSLYSQDEIIGKHFSFFAHKDTEKIVYDNINKSLQNQQEWSGKLKNIKKDGTAFWINMKIKPMYNKYGDVTGYTSLMFDITNEINLNGETSVLQEEVLKAKEEINQKDELLVQQSKLAIMTETLQRLSHEWRQPLNLISIQAQKLEFAYSLADDLEVEDTVKTLQKIKSEADNLSFTIENFQKFLKPNDEKTITKPSTIIDEVVKIFNSETTNSSIKIDINIKDDIEFNSYPNELITVFMNLFINSKEAIERTEMKKGVIKISEKVENNSIVFEIKDNGCGIDNNILHQIFEPYFSTKEQKHGVGLGLYTSKIIVNMHLNGIITAKSTKNGTTFKISIPIEN